MEKLLIILGFILLVLTGYSQVTDVGELRIANATTEFGRNLPVGTKVYNVATGHYWVATVGVAKTATLTTAAASFMLFNSDDQTASEVDITDSGGHYSSDNVEGALQEIGDSIGAHRTIIDQNVSKITAISDSIGIHRNVINAINTALENITEGFSLITETFEEDNETANEHNLSKTAIVSNGCRVSLNGATLEPANYTFTASFIKVKVPVLQYDRIVITYLY